MRMRRLLCGIGAAAGALCLALPAAASADPVSATAPVIAATAPVDAGTVVTLTPGAWLDQAAYVVTDTWEVCAGGTCSPVALQPIPDTSYTVTALNAATDGTLEVVEVATDPATSTSTTKDSNAIALAGPPAGGSATIGGTAKVGGTLTATTSGWSNDPTSYAYEWLDCRPGGGQCQASPTSTNAASYTVTNGDVGDAIEVQVTAANSSGPGAPAVSNPTATVAAYTAGPTISGSATEGATLTANPGTWSLQPAPSFQYQWQACASTCTNIAGATGPTFRLDAAEVGDTVDVVVTATSATTVETAASGKTATVGATAPVNDAAPAISGTAEENLALTLAQGSWTYGTVTGDQWQRCTSATNCSNISGQTGPTYVPTAADVGHAIRVAETASNGGLSTTAYSAQTAAVILPPPTNTASPGIAGTAQQGQTLTESPAQWTNSPSSTAVQWYLCNADDAACTAIPGATGKTLLLTAGDVGGTLKVAETAFDQAGSSTAYSSYTAPVTTPAGVVPPPVLSSGAPAVSGTAVMGSTLTATQATFTNNPSVVSAQWLRCGGGACAAIPGATGLSYALTSADVGSTVTVQETATNTGGTSQPTVAPVTAVIKAGSAVSVQVNPAAPVAAQATTLVVTVSSGAAAAPPAGTVTLTADGQPIAACPAQSISPSGATATVTCRASFGASTHSISAALTPAATALVTASSSAPVAVDVGRASTVASLSAPTRATLDAKTRYVATVLPPAGSGAAPAPTGPVAFLDGGKAIAGCGRVTLTNQSAACTVTYTKIATHAISVAYLGDGNFAGSSTAAKRVTVAAGQPSGYVTAYLTWTFQFSRSYTKVIALSASGIAPQTTFSVSCTGGGCPFAQYRHTVAKPKRCGRSTAKRKKRCTAPKSFGLRGLFAKRRLRVGAQITIDVTHARWVGKYYRFTIRSGRKPRLDESCLAVGSRRPSVGCRTS